MTTRQVVSVRVIRQCANLLERTDRKGTWSLQAHYSR